MQENILRIELTNRLVNTQITMLKRDIQKKGGDSSGESSKKLKRICFNERRKLMKKIKGILFALLLTLITISQTSLAAENVSILSDTDPISPRYTVTCPSGKKHRMKRMGNAIAIYLNNKEIWKDSYKATYVCEYCNDVICVRDHPVNYYSPIGDYVHANGYSGIKDLQYIYVSQTYHESGTQLDGYDFINAIG